MKNSHRISGGGKISPTISFPLKDGSTFMESSSRFDTRKWDIGFTTAVAIFDIKYLKITQNTKKNEKVEIVNVERKTDKLFSLQEHFLKFFFLKFANFLTSILILNLSWNTLINLQFWTANKFKTQFSTKIWHSNWFKFFSCQESIKLFFFCVAFFVSSTLL